jgi:hypothetical protein
MQPRTWKSVSLLLGASLVISAAVTATPVTARRAAGGDDDAIAELRAAGPSGVEDLLTLAAAEPGLGESPAFQQALDAVCAQRDCAASRLYWYTDLAAAREAARRTGRPILYLRLLGRLDEELSCANSRFFRAVLYANASVASVLRDRFVLYWHSERPVPKVSVDFGDGRRLEGTITGNSIHYVLDQQGRLVDALPGLYGPQAFLSALGWAEAEAKRLADLPDPQFDEQRARYHRDRLESLQTSLTRDLRELGVENPDLMAATTINAARWGGGKPIYSAVRASRLAMMKSVAERPLLTAITLDPAGSTDPAEITPLDVASLHRDEAVLDDASRRLLRTKLGSWVGAPGLETSFERFEQLLAEDTVRNEYLLHGTLHTWLAEPELGLDLGNFNTRVYLELFRTPGWDPWLGLAPRELYSVLTPAPGSVVEPPPPPPPATPVLTGG